MLHYSRPVIFCFALAVLASATEPSGVLAGEPGESLENQRIAILVADGYIDRDVHVPKAFVRDRDGETVLVGPETGVVAASNVVDDTVRIEATASDVHSGDFDGLVIPGGRAPSVLAKSESAVELVRDFLEAGKPIAAIRQGPLLVAKAGGANGRRLTGHKGIADNIRDTGGFFVNRSVVVDRGVATARVSRDRERFVAAFASLLSNPGQPFPPLDGVNIGILTAHGFNDAETLEPKAFFDDLGARTVLIGPVTGEVAASNTYATIHIEKSIMDATVEEFDALIVPGGLAPQGLMKHLPALDLVRDFVNAGRPVAAICHGPLVLLGAGVADSREMTAHKDLVKKIDESGGTFVNRPVAIDDNVITSRLSRDFPEFHEAIKRAILDTRRD